MDLLYTAEIGKGAFLNGEKITVSEVCDLVDAKILAKKSVFEKENWKNGQSNILRQRYRPSLAYRLALVAEGSFDAMITLGKSWEWDICAGHLLVTEAGGSVTTSHGSDINYNSSTGSSQGIIAGNAIVREAISAQLNL
jgi:myo-inositol-1(or 4)-monophosphatase